MKKSILICLFLLSGQYDALACINDLVQKPADWTDIKRDFGPLLQVDSIPQAQLFNYLHYLEEREREEPSFKNRNDMAVVYMRLSDPSTARNILIELEQENPGNYSVAANLGTAYELLGELDSALFWIKKAVSIEPNAHQGSEWIHVMILRYRLAKDKNPQYLSGSSALMLDFGNLDIPTNPYGLNIDKLTSELGYQLRERLSFISPPDTLMGMLLFDYANLVALSSNPAQSLWYYQAAQDFGFESDLLDARIRRIEDITSEKPNARLDEFAGEEVDTGGDGIQVYALAGLIAILAVVGVWLLLRKGKK